MSDTVAVKNNFSSDAIQYSRETAYYGLGSGGGGGGGGSAVIISPPAGVFSASSRQVRRFLLEAQDGNSPSSLVSLVHRLVSSRTR